MLRCFCDGPVSSLDLSLSISLAEDGQPLEEGPSSAPERPTAAAATATRTFDVTMSVCRVRLMRVLAFKGQTLTPFIPTKQLLLLFPCSIETTTRAGLAQGAVNKMAAFLTMLHRASGGIMFGITCAMLCVASGNAALVLECDSVDDSLALQDACGSVNRHGQEEVRMTSLMVEAILCQYIPPEKLATEAQRRELLQDLYDIPCCTLCAERLEKSLTEGSDSPERQVCACFGAASSTAMGSAAPPQRSCTCLQKSACTVCQQLLSVQLASTSGSGQPQVRCQECRQSGDPWICMICGYVGCSRYQAMHAKDHFVHSGHFFSINLLTQQIWDYHSDAFVHHVMFIVDAKSGKATRLQYPGHEDASTRALLDASDGNDDDGSGAAAGEWASQSHKHVNPVTEKKVVSGKYDAKLTTSHSQYATVLKNELDALRVIHTENAWMAVRAADPETTLTKEVIARIMEHARVVLPREGGDGGSHSDSDVADDSSSCAAASANSTTPHSPQPLKDDGKRVDREFVSYDAMFASLAPLEAILVASRHEEQAAAYGTQHLAHELEMREQESAPLEEEEDALTAEMRAVVRKNVMDNLELNSAIEELQTTLREIDLNVATQQQLLARMGSGEAAARVVVMGQGHTSGKGKGGGGGGGTSKPSKRS